MLLILWLISACGGDEATRTPASQTQPQAQVPTSAFSQPASIEWQVISGQVAPSREFELEVRLDPQGRGISGVQFDLQFTPSVVEVVNIRPGPLLGPSPLEVNNPGDKPGILVYAAARQGATKSNTPPGAVATMRLRVLDKVPVGTKLDLSLANVQLADENIQRVPDILVTPLMEVKVTDAK